MTWQRLNEHLWQLWDDTLVVGIAECEGSVWVGNAVGTKPRYSLTFEGIQAKVEADYSATAPLQRTA